MAKTTGMARTTITPTTYGAEGATDDAEILETRERQKRNFLLTLLTSQGVPMICGGDEICRTQQGNNNAYAQDSSVSWYDWNLDDRRRSLFEFTRRLVEMRRQHPNLHRRKFFQDRGINPGTEKRQVNGHTEPDITWLRPDGLEMTPEEWNQGWVRCIGLQLNGRTLDDVNGVGEAIRDETFMILLNPHHEPIRFFHAAKGRSRVGSPARLRSSRKERQGGDWAGRVPRVDRAEHRPAAGVDGLRWSTLCLASD